MSQQLQHQSWMGEEFVVDQTMAEMYVARKKAEMEQRRIHEKLAELQNQLGQQGLQNAQNQYANEMAQALQQAGFDPNQFMKKPMFPHQPPPFAGQSFPNMANPVPPAAPPALDEDSPAADEAQKQALAAMNPIARHKYAELFKVLEIKVRFTNMARSAGGGTAWILAKMGADGKMIRQEWSAPSKDPGCSMRTWEAMMGELMDEVTRRKGIHVATDADHSAESTGSEKPGSSAGNP